MLLSLRDQIFGRIHENDGGATPVGWRKPRSADILIEGRKKEELGKLRLCLGVQVTNGYQWIYHNSRILLT